MRKPPVDTIDKWVIAIGVPLAIFAILTAIWVSSNRQEAEGEERRRILVPIASLTQEVESPGDNVAGA